MDLTMENPDAKKDEVNDPMMTYKRLSTAAREYAAGPEATNKKYSGKWLIVEGEVADKSKEGPAKIYLKGNGKVRVKCDVSTFEQQLTAPMRPGQHVQLLGQYARTSSNTDTEVGLYDCLPITPSK